jgi:hypothetical protein
MEAWLVSDDIATQLRWISDTKQWVKLRDWTKITTDAANEIDNLRAERLYWFNSARELAWKALSNKECSDYLDEEINNYLRTRGRCEDPRDCFE